MIILLENTTDDDLTVQVIDALQVGHPTVFDGMLLAGEIANIDVRCDSGSSAKIAWHARRADRPDSAPHVGDGTPGPGDTVDIHL